MRYPKLHQILFSVNLLLVLLPLGGIGAFRLYETELIRQTEASLIAQGVFIKEVYLSHFNRIRKGLDDAAVDHMLGAKVEKNILSLSAIRPGEFYEIYPKIKVSEQTKRPPLPEAQQTEERADEVSLALGQILEPMLRNAQFNLLSGIRIVNKDGIVIATTRSEMGKSLIAREEVRRALSGEPVSLVRERKLNYARPTHEVFSFGTSTIVFYAQPIIWKGSVLGAVVLSRTPLNLAKAMSRHRKSLYFYFAIMIFIILIVTLTTAAFITRPMKQLIDQAESVKTGKSARVSPLKNAGSFEVNALSNAIVAMAKAMDDRANYLKDFANHISHEFKTPIAAIKGSVEVLEDHLGSMSEQERLRFFKMIRKDATRMEHLVEKLLELAKAETIKESLDSCLVSAAFNDLEAYYESRDINLTVDKSHLNEFEKIGLSQSNLFTCLKNLVENSLQHAGGNTAVSISVRSHSQKIVITVIDDGPGFDQKDIHRIAEPFFTTARETGGTGLGLSIVKSLVASARGSVAFPPRKSGAEVVLEFPLSLA